jgi:uncharacterized membrane protein
MCRTAARLAVIAVVCWIVMKIVFGFAGGIIGLLLSLAWFALKVLLVVGIIYWLLSVFSPETAQKVKDSMRRETM